MSERPAKQSAAAMTAAEMIERAAMAIHQAFANRSGRARSWSALPESLCQQYRREAEAALRAVGVIEMRWRKQVQHPYQQKMLELPPVQNEAGQRRCDRSGAMVGRLRFRRRVHDANRRATAEGERQRSHQQAAKNRRC